MLNHSKKVILKSRDHAQIDQSEWLIIKNNNNSFDLILITNIHADWLISKS